MRGLSWKYRDDENEAPLKALMIVQPMTAQQHLELIQKRIERRRKLETARELKTVTDENPWW